MTDARANSCGKILEADRAFASTRPRTRIFIARHVAADAACLHTEPPGIRLEIPLDFAHDPQCTGAPSGPSLGSRSVARNGWTDGRAEALRRLVEPSTDVPWLTAHDHRVAATNSSRSSRIRLMDLWLEPTRDDRRERRPGRGARFDSMAPVVPAPVDRYRTFGTALVARDATRTAGESAVVTEEPLEIRIDGRPLAVVMRTPGDDLELAAGFLRAEGIVRDGDDIALIRHCRDEDGAETANVINVELTEFRRNAADARLAARHAERATVTSTSCGVCGKRTIEALTTEAPPFDAESAPKTTVVAALPPQLREAQSTFDATGGLHAAGLFDATGRRIIAREDVGRHNAVDKVVGALTLMEHPVPDGGILMVSGRTSFEIVQKALVARIPIIAAVSAPTTLAIELAAASRMTLIGFVRAGSFTVYTGSVLD